jgi:peptidoglycan/LPS O-acetylase OafA/YrhL
MWPAAYRVLSSWFETPHGSRKQFPPIEGLRGFATLLVFLVHYVTLIEPWLAPSTATFKVASFLYAIGHSGVDLFFVLSGFLIYGGLLGRPAPLAPYVRRRIQRIYPTFTAVFVLYVAASWLVPRESKLPAGAPATALYLAANYLLLPGMFEIEPMITVAWSLSYEMFFFLACPLLIVVLGLRRWPAAIRVALFLAMAVGLIWLSPVIESRTRLAMFLAGMALWDTLRPVKNVMLPFAAVLAAALGFAVCYVVEQRELGPGVWTFGLFVAFYVLCYAALQDDGPLARLFAWTPLRWFGNMSYSFFLLHGLMLKGLFLFLATRALPAARWEATFWLLLPVAFLAALLPSAVLYLLIERPFSLAPVRSIG